MSKNTLYIIAIDPASESGVVHGTSMQDCKAASWDFKPKPATKKRKSESKTARYGKLWIALDCILDDLEEDYNVGLVFESAKGFMRGKSAVEVSHGLRGVIQAFCYIRQIQTACIQPQELKRFATGNGGADKDAMIRASRQYGYTGDNDNIADAYHLFAWALKYQDVILKETEI